MIEENHNLTDKEDPRIHEAETIASQQPQRQEFFKRSILSRSRVRLFLLSIIIVFFVYFLLYAATASVRPGNVLYALKTDVLEEIMPVFKFGAESKGTYQLTLMERRLRELVGLEQRGKLDDATFGIFLSQIEENQRSLTDIIAEHEDGALSRAGSLTLLRSAVAYARACEIVIESIDANSDREEQIEDTRREIENLYDDKVEQFVAKSSDAEVKGYLDAELNTVTALSEGREMDRELEDDVGDALDEVGDALTEVDIAGAITAASEAVRYFQVIDVLKEAKFE